MFISMCTSCAQCLSLCLRLVHSEFIIMGTSSARLVFIDVCRLCHVHGDNLSVYAYSVGDVCLL